MKIKVSEAAPAQLNWMVATCEGGRWDAGRGLFVWSFLGVEEAFSICSPDYCGDWSKGGPIIEREKLMVQPLLRSGDWYGEWRSVCLSWEGRTYADTLGLTPLIAAMRCYVESKLGDEVDVPEELT